MRVVARAPNHLGDGVMALPALHALARVGALTIQAPAWGGLLYRGVDAAVEPRGEVAEADAAVLFPPSFRVAWQARRAVRRIGTATDLRAQLLTDIVEPRAHRAETYAALASVLGAQAQGPPVFEPGDADAVDVPDGHIGLNPVSPSGAVVEWRGFAKLAAQSRRAVVFYGGPGEHERVAAIAQEHQSHVGLPLDVFAATLRRCAVFVSNDSGAAHFARAVGVPTVVVHGSTIAAKTGAYGAVAVDGPDVPCRPCYKKHCAHAFECLDISLERVAAAVEVACV